MRRIHWISVILLLLHAAGCASEVVPNEQQKLVVKKRGTESGAETGIVVQQPTPPPVHQPSPDHVNHEITPPRSSKPSDGYQQQKRDNGRQELLSDPRLTRPETFEQGTLLPEAKESEDGAGELSNMAGQEKKNFPFVADMLEEEEKLYEKAANNLSEETSHAISRNDSKLTMNSESMSPSSATKSASVSPAQRVNDVDSLENRTSRVSSHFNVKEDLSHQSSPEPDSIESLLEKGRAYLSGGEHEMAYAEFDRLVGLSNSALSYYYRGYASIKLHRSKEAVSDFSQAIQLSRDIDTRQYRENSSLTHQTLRDSYRERAFAYFQVQQPRLALADITTFLEMSAGDQVVLTDEYVLRGRVYTALERTELAITDFSEALRFTLASRSQAYIYYLRGLSFFRIKKFQLGLQDMDQSCRLRFEKACGFFEQIQ